MGNEPGAEQELEGSVLAAGQRLPAADVVAEGATVEQGKRPLENGLSDIVEELKGLRPLNPSIK